MCVTHRIANDCAMEFKISMSLLNVSWNPGVSINITGRPSTVNSSEAWTSSVQDLRSVPTESLDLLARLMNCSGEIRQTDRTRDVLTDVLPLPVAPITLGGLLFFRW